MDTTQASTNSTTPKVALVTGASSGIGRETARRLLDAGFVVYVAARRLEQMDELKAAGALPLRMDITREEDVRAVVAAITTHHGAVDVLVNNAGFASYGAMEDTSLEDARYQFEVNLFGLARLTQLLLPGMRERKAGVIINVSSMGGRIYSPLGAWYHATKHALEGFSDCLRLELAQFGIKVVIIEPGLINTEFNQVFVAPMLERSSGGVYGKMAKAMAEATRRVDARGEGSPPAVVADAILDAVRARRPRTRYAMGKLAKPLMFIRKYFGDRLFDQAIMAQLG